MASDAPNAKPLLGGHGGSSLSLSNRINVSIKEKGKGRKEGGGRKRKGEKGGGGDKRGEKSINNFNY